jgi:hypothetical protein
MTEKYPGEYAVLVRNVEADNATLRAQLIDLQLRYAAVVVELESLRSWAQAVRAAVKVEQPRGGA